jgi:uncharacterized membrane protein YukC
MSLKKEIKRKVEYILNMEDDEATLNQLNEELASYQKKLEESAWERTSEEEKQEIRAAFESLKREENRISQAEMDNFLNSWRERLSTQQ